MNNERSGEFSEFLAAKAEQVERQWNDCMANSVLTALTEGGNESRHHRSASVTLYAQRDAVMRLVSNTMAGFRKDAIDATKELADLRAQLAAAKAEVERKDARIRMLTIELDGAVNHHDYTRNKVDRALGEPRFNDCDIWTAFERAIATKDATIAAQAAEIEERDVSISIMTNNLREFRGDVEGRVPPINTPTHTNFFCLGLAVQALKEQLAAKDAELAKLREQGEEQRRRLECAEWLFVGFADRGEDDCGVLARFAGDKGSWIDIEREGNQGPRWKAVRFGGLVPHGFLEFFDSPIDALLDAIAANWLPSTQDGGAG